MNKIQAINEKIDFVIPWVDGDDPSWVKCKNRYTQDSTGDTRIIRFRDWDNLQYWFRGIEVFTPWVNKIHFITWGHLPQWLNIEHPKVNIVNHEDYIPRKFLPTFNSHVIELNLHRIPGLASKFVYFNDDTFIIDKMESSDFFKSGLPRDSAVIWPYISNRRNSIGSIVSNNMTIINSNFNKNKVIKQNFFKWFNIRYGEKLIGTLLNMPYKSFVGLYSPHLPNSYLKSTFEDVWSKENEFLDNTCSHKFRDARDINQWIMRYWQLATANFSPRSIKIGKSFSITNDNEILIKTIQNQKKRMICMNDSDFDAEMDFEVVKEEIKQAFNHILPQKSSFEY